MSELYDAILALKLQGNEHYNKQEWDTAKHFYEMAINDIVNAEPFPEQAEKRQFDELKADCYGNLVKCYYELQNIELFLSSLNSSLALNIILQIWDKVIEDAKMLFDYLIKENQVQQVSQLLLRLQFEGSPVDTSKAQKLINAHNDNYGAMVEAIWATHFAREKEGEISQEERYTRVVKYILSLS